MLATAPSPSSASSQNASARYAPPVSPPPGYSPIETAAPPGNRCRYCCADVPREAKKCRACGEWLVRTSSGIAAPLLRLLGWVWAVLSCVAAATLWYIGSAIRTQMVMMSADQYLTPLGLDVAVYAIVLLVLLQGLTVGIGVNVLARLVPRRPYWWS
jgi:hypothetical protein